jgi:Brp/Blh family beta-carotene 15,15'-monooxygenase
MVWRFFPALSLVFFLLLSAFHFGESQLSRYGRAGFLQLLLFLLWGLHILSAYTYYQYDALALHMASSAMFVPLQPVIAAIGGSPVVLLLRGLATVLLGCKVFLLGRLDLQAMLQEAFLVLMIHASFIAFGPIVSFTLFFVVIHSLQVLSHEWLYLKDKFVLKGLSQFVVLLLPISLVSIAGLGLVYGLNAAFFDLPVVYLTIVMTAVITLPHAVVMHFFYDKTSTLT